MSVEIQLESNRPELPPDLQEEFDDWDRASAGAIEMVERLLAEDSSLVRIDLGVIKCNKKTS